MQVALRWFGNPGGHTLPPGVPGCCGEFDTLHLWVYKDGALIASSPGIIAVSQSTFIPKPENGWYDVWIAYDPSYNVAPAVEYEALAEVEYLPRIHPAKRLLPDLTFHGTERISFDTPSFPIFEPDPPPGSSCFQSEMDEDGAQTCLRFDQIIANRGQGPVEICTPCRPDRHPTRTWPSPCRSGFTAAMDRLRIVRRVLSTTTPSTVTITTPASRMPCCGSRIAGVQGWEINP